MEGTCLAPETMPVMKAIIHFKVCVRVPSTCCHEPLGGDACEGVVSGGGRRSTVLAGLYEGGLGSGNWGVRYGANNPIETKEVRKLERRLSVSCPTYIARSAIYTQIYTVQR
jgi:hypothetical protein